MTFGAFQARSLLAPAPSGEAFSSAPLSPLLPISAGPLSSAITGGPLRIGHYMRHMFEPGGIASYIRRVSEAQRAAGHEVVYFDRSDPTAVCLHSHPDGQAIIYTADDHDLLRRATELGLDILHAHTTLDPEILPTPGAMGAGPQIIRTVHTHAPYCPSQGRFLKRPGVPCDRGYSLAGCLWGHLFNRCGSARFAVLRKNFRTTQQERAALPHLITVVVSQFLKDEMVRAGYPAKNIHVLHLPAPPANDPTAATSAPSEDARPRFLFLGRMIPHKGVDWLLRSLRLVKADVVVDLGGAGGHEAEYRDLARRRGLESRTRFLGWLSPQQVGHSLSTARALIFPSLWHEPGGTVAFEAMAHAKPVIVSRVGGMPEVVEDGVTGLIVPPGDEAALAHAIDTLAASEPLARRMGAAGLQRATDRYNLDEHVAQLMNLYQGVIA